MLNRSAMFRALALSTLVITAGCASAPSQPGELIADPYESTNRSIHAFNKGVDSVILDPLGEAYGAAVPATIKLLLKNEVQHLKLPGIFVNRVLQGDARMAGRVLGRFTLNTTMGAAGLLDPATEFGLPYEPTDFGVTLASWGADEGIYHEVPFFGPMTTRRLAGRVVDFVIDPSILLTTGAVEAGTVITALDTARTPVDIVIIRNENDELIDGILYESEDSYVTSRAGYVQSRRRFVNGGTTSDDLPDLFEE